MGSASPFVTIFRIGMLAGRCALCVYLESKAKYSASSGRRRALSEALFLVNLGVNGWISIALPDHLEVFAETF
jgi:hypothetical protein